jgi:hypothetical protein
MLKRVLGVPILGEFIPIVVAAVIISAAPVAIAISDMWNEIETAHIRGSKPCPPPIFSTDAITRSADSKFSVGF